ncbi:MAG: YfbM family protein [Deltaproteobacteria bacterium]|nr:YfbM family protein [Deltaproteobacteria bacterium]
MSMIGYLMRVSPEQYDGLVSSTLAPDEILPESMYERASEDLRSDPAIISLEKMWNALHFLFSGTAFECQGPLGDLILGGQEIGDDMGYGPGRVLSVAEVQDLNQKLSATPNAELRRRFQPAQLEAANVYPPVWDEPEEDLWGELAHYLERLRAIYSTAAKNGDALLLWVA